MSKLSKSLRLKLSTGILLMAIPIFVLALGLLLGQSRRFIRQEAGEHASSLLNTTMHHMKKYMLATEMAANSNTWFVEQHFQPDSLLALSRRIVALNGNIHSCTISAEPDMFPQYGRHYSVYTVKRGDSIFSTREQSYEYFDRQWYKAPIENGDGCWVEPVFEHSEGIVRLDKAVLSYCKPLYDKDKKEPNGKKRVVGVLCVDLSFSLLKEAINATKFDYPDSYVFMLGANGCYLIHPDSTRLFRKTIFSDLDPQTNADIIAIGHEMTAGKDGNMHATINGRYCHVTFRPIPSSKWSIALVCPDREILKGNNQLINIIIVLIVIGMGVIFWLSRRIAGHAIRPINYLVEMTQQMSEGHYDVEIPQSKREDAIGQLQNSFVTMQQSINDQIGSIRQTMDETQRQNGELVAAMKLAEEGVRQKSLFIQNVSHQIRTPLNIIQGFAQVLQEGQNLPETEFQEIRRMMKYNAMHLKRMVTMLFDSSDTGVMEDWNSQQTDQISCNEIARECISYTENHFPGLTIRFVSKEPDSFQIQTNKLYLVRSLHELLYNAAKYSDFNHITMRVWQTEATARFTVEDVGLGLPTELLSQVFMPFNKTNDLSEGLGLGLSLSRRHIISLGGDLELDPDYHDGCRFTVILPK